MRRRREERFLVCISIISSFITRCSCKTSGHFERKPEWARWYAKSAYSIQRSCSVCGTTYTPIGFRNSVALTAANGSERVRYACAFSFALLQSAWLVIDSRASPAFPYNWLLRQLYESSARLSGFVLNHICVTHRWNVKISLDSFRDRCAIYYDFVFSDGIIQPLRGVWLCNRVIPRLISRVCL